MAAVGQELLDSIESAECDNASGHPPDEGTNDATPRGITPSAIKQRADNNDTARRRMLANAESLLESKSRVKASPATFFHALP